MKLQQEPATRPVIRAVRDLYGVYKEIINFLQVRLHFSFIGREIIDLLLHSCNCMQHQRCKKHTNPAVVE